MQLPEIDIIDRINQSPESQERLKTEQMRQGTMAIAVICMIVLTVSTVLWQWI
jgi:hypothetical protein